MGGRDYFVINSVMNNPPSSKYPLHDAAREGRGRLKLKSPKPSFFGVKNSIVAAAESLLNVSVDPIYIVTSGAAAHLLPRRTLSSPFNVTMMEDCRFTGHVPTITCLLSSI